MVLAGDERRAARRRRTLLALLVARAVGLLLSLAGVLLWRTAELGGRAPPFGQLLVAVGLLVLLIAPALLRRRLRRL